MKAKKGRRSAPSQSEREKRAERSVETGGAPQGAASVGVSRRSLIKGTAAAAAVVGVTSAVTGMPRSPRQEQASSASSTSYVTISPTATNTATVPAPAPVVTTDPFGMRTITLSVNGTNYNVNVEPRTMLVDVIRNDLGLIAIKKPCNRMQCGGCTVLIDGVPHESCTYMALRGVGHSIVTPEIAAGDAVVNALQLAWSEADGGQCSYCGPGMIMAATALLKSNPQPTVPQIKTALSGNLCRCGNYVHIIAAVQQAATSLGGT